MRSIGRLEVAIVLIASAMIAGCVVPTPGGMGYGPTLIPSGPGNHDPWAGIGDKLVVTRVNLTTSQPITTRPLSLDATRDGDGRIRLPPALTENASLAVLVLLETPGGHLKVVPGWLDGERIPWILLEGGRTLNLTLFGDPDKTRLLARMDDERMTRDCRIAIVGAEGDASGISKNLEAGENASFGIVPHAGCPTWSATVSREPLWERRPWGACRPDACEP